MALTHLCSISRSLGTAPQGKLCPYFVPPQWGSTPAWPWQVPAVLFLLLLLPLLLPLLLLLLLLLLFLLLLLLLFLMLFLLLPLLLLLLLLPLLLLLLLLFLLLLLPLLLLLLLLLLLPTARLGMAQLPCAGHIFPVPGTASLRRARLPCAGQAARLMPISCNGKLQSHSSPSGLMGTAGITRLPRPSLGGFPAAPEPAGSRSAASFPGRRSQISLCMDWGKQFVNAG